MILVIISITFSFAKTPTLEIATYDTLLNRCEVNNKMYEHLFEKTKSTKYLDSIMITLEIYASIKKHKTNVINHYKKSK